MRLSDLHERSANTIYRVDTAYRIVYFNPAYFRFACENGQPNITRDWGNGASVLDCVPPPIRRQLQRFYDRAFAGEVVEHDYTCHSPENYRQFLLRLVRDREGTVIAEHSLIVQQPHRDILDLNAPAPASDYTHDTGLIIRCCNCNKVKSAVEPTRWDLVRNFLGTAHDRISHGLCSVCIEQLYPGLVTASA